MQRMIQSMNYSGTIALLAIAFSATFCCQQSSGQGPMVRQADADFDASGYVTPAGMVPPSMYNQPVMQVGYNSNSFDNTPYSSSCDGESCSSGGCDSYGPVGYDETGHGSCGGCGSGGGCGSCGGKCGLLSCCGFLKKMTSRGNDGLSPLRHVCPFCRGPGCSACQSFRCGSLLGALRILKPYGEAGLGAQRWYDVSVETLFLTYNGGGGNTDVTSLGQNGSRVLNLRDANAGDDLEIGMRLSVAMIFGAGGNLEATYMGNNQWSSSASASDPGFGLFSFISDFGTDPAGGFDDTDRSQLQTIRSTSAFHSGELNYRRRTVGPYRRFQGSWLVGLRYLRFDNGLGYSTLGANDNTVNATLPRFFSSNDEIKNEMWGPQAGFDLWWNVIPGLNVGCGLKGAWVQNNIDRNTILRANSLGPVATAGTRVVRDSTRDTTIMGEAEAKVVYRLSHSWSLRSAYYLIAVQDAGFANTNPDAILNFIDPVNNPSTNQTLNVNDLVLQGFSLGLEYIW